MPPLGFGTYRLTGDACSTAVETAIGVGYRHFDTAQMYRNETDVGRGLLRSGIDRESVFLTTKIWRDSLSRSRLRPSVERSLQKLGTDYVDLLLIHWPNPHVPVQESMEAMLELQEAGWARQLGVCNFPPSLLKKALLSGPLANVQVEYHPYLSQGELLSLVRQEGLTLTAYSPLAQGLVFKDPTLRTLGVRHGKSAGQVALRWLLQQPSVAAIPRSSNAAHIRANFEIWDFELSSREMSDVDALDEGRRLVSPGFAMDWERSDEALWVMGRRVPQPVAPAVRAGRRVARALRRVIRAGRRVIG